MKNNIYKKMYMLATVVFMIQLILIIFFKHGDEFNKFFFIDTIDTGMDFFNSVLYTKGGHPYTGFGTIYPPLANLLFWFICQSVPLNKVEKWPNTFAEGIKIRGTAEDLRLNQILFFYFLLLMIIVVVLFIFVMSYAYDNVRYGMVMGMALLFSYGSLFAFERGNIINLAVCFLLFFLLFYQSENKILKEIALIALAISAGLKLYPAIFGVLLLIDKKWKEAVRAIIYGCISIFVPFGFFDGIEGMQSFFSVLTTFTQTGTEIKVSGYAFQNMLQCIIKQLSLIFGFEFELAVTQGKVLISVCKWCVIIFLLINLFISKKRWEKYLALGFLVLFIQNAGNYTLLFLLPAIVEICKEEEYDIRTVVYFILMSIVHLPIPFLGVNTNLTINYSVQLRQYVLLIMVALIVRKTIMELVGIIREQIVQRNLYSFEKLKVVRSE